MERRIQDWGKEGVMDPFVQIYDVRLSFRLLLHFFNHL